MEASPRTAFVDAAHGGSQHSRKRQISREQALRLREVQGMGAIDDSAHDSRSAERGLTRRRLLRYSFVSAAVMSIVAACQQAATPAPTTAPAAAPKPTTAPAAAPTTAPAAA